MTQIITKQEEIAEAFLSDVAQGDWTIKLEKNDFEEASSRHKPFIAVRAEDDKSISELASVALEEIRKTNSRPTDLIMTLSFRQDDRPMMQEMTRLNDCLSTFVDKGTRMKWGLQSLAEMPCKRRVTITAFA